MLLLGTYDEEYLSGFVGVCLIQYFQKKHAGTAYAVLLRLLTWKINFTKTLPSCMLEAVDVIEIAVNVSIFMHVHCTNDWDFQVVIVECLHSAMPLDSLLLMLMLDLSHARSSVSLLFTARFLPRVSPGQSPLPPYAFTSSLPL